MIVVAVLLAQRSLVDHVDAVANALHLSLAEGRAAVAKIVGRDTAAMDEPDVARAAIESAAENLSDGVIAPAFWFLLLGLPGLLAYKMVNTADSMIGYRTPQHEDFGKAAARVDDVLNWIPARLTAAAPAPGAPPSRRLGGDPARRPAAPLAQRRLAGGGDGGEPRRRARGPAQLPRPASPTIPSCTRKGRTRSARPRSTRPSPRCGGPGAPPSRS